MTTFRALCVALAAVALPAACDDSTVPLDALDTAAVDWIEGRWTDTAVELRVVGNGGCLGPERIDMEIRPRHVGWADLIVLPRPARRPPEGCADRLLDTTLLLPARDLPAAVTVWATYPYQPGIRSFLTAFQGSFLTSAAGEVRIDTLPGGCLVIRPMAPNANLVYALWPGPLELEPGDIVFLRGTLGRAGCGGLNGLEGPIIPRTAF